MVSIVVIIGLVVLFVVIVIINNAVINFGGAISTIFTWVLSIAILVWYIFHFFVKNNQIVIY